MVISSLFYHQFPDCWELRSIYNATPLTKSKLSELPVQFVFAVQSPRTSANGLNALTGLGFKPIATMNNWFYAHSNAVRHMTFWWKEVHRSQEQPQPVNKYGYSGVNRGDPYDPYYQANGQFTSGGGCGFQCAEWPLPHIRKNFFQFFSLLRLPINPDRRTRHLMALANYSRLANGSMSSYWLNGWNPNTYSWKDVEHPFWKARMEAWKRSKSQRYFAKFQPLLPEDIKPKIYRDYD